MDSDKINETAYLRRIIPCLLDWYEENKRKLPWRDNPLPYYVWISEIMLQQTRVEAVKPYFQRFLEALPTVKDLADCPEDRLMKLWQGLGYYSRVRNMQRAARLMVDMYGGRVPEQAKELQSLPGIGSYTAAAIASIAYGRCEAAVDGNVLRVVSRICDDRACVDEPKVKKHWELTLKQVMEKAGSAHGQASGPEVFSRFWSPGNFNQAMMEIGALICLPNGEPLCDRCPLGGLCLAHREGCETALPVRRTKKNRRLEERTVLVVTENSRTVLHRRDKSGLLAGLWEPPNFEGRLEEETALEKVREMGLVPAAIRELPAAKHIFSHIEWHMTGFLVTENSREKPQEGDRGDFILKTEDGKEYLLTETDTAREKYAVPSAFAPYMKYLGMKKG